MVNEDSVIAADPEMQGSHMQHDYSYTNACVNETMHMTDASHEMVESLHSALREVCLENKTL